MNDKVLPYPEKPIIECMPTLLDFAISGWFVPEIVVVNENLLADDLSLAIGDELDHLDMRDKYDIIHEVDRDLFKFTVDLSFDVIEVKGWYMVEITEIKILASWGKNREGLSIELPVKWSEELLTSIIENQVRILI